ncbi:MAG TPA: hypothetical protein VGN25_04955 [Solirubrobacteraceae bacterium]|jgi:hypothetical protein|nr:hypothetical protein [Solirubrobacteraceae bacterium]
MPWRSASSAQRSVPATPIVLICAHTSEPLAVERKPSSPSITSNTASASGSIVITTAAPCAPCAGVSTIVAPCSASGWAFSRVRFQARSGMSARAMFAPIPSPIVPPAPSSATVAFVLMSDTYPRLARG